MPLSPTLGWELFEGKACPGLVVSQVGCTELPEENIKERLHVCF